MILFELVNGEERDGRRGRRAGQKRRTWVWYSFFTSSSFLVLALCFVFELDLHVYIYIYIEEN